MGVPENIPNPERIGLAFVTLCNPLHVYAHSRE